MSGADICDVATEYFTHDSDSESRPNHCLRKPVQCAVTVTFTDIVYDWQMRFNPHQLFVMRLIKPLTLSSFSNNTQLMLFIINVTFP